MAEVNDPAVSLSGYKERQQLIIEVHDNGHGIMENIFIPFYTTKKEGSGIGLSLGRQIMRSHGGSIR